MKQREIGPLVAAAIVTPFILGALKLEPETSAPSRRLIVIYVFFGAFLVFYFASRLWDRFMK